MKPLWQSIHRLTCIVSGPLPDQWKGVAAPFSSHWTFHHTLGFIDGNHVRISFPKNGGLFTITTMIYTPIALLTMVDADYRFLRIDVDTNSSCSGTQILGDCDLKMAILDGSIGFPHDELLPVDDGNMISHDAFAL